MSDIAPSGPLAVLKTEPGGYLSQGDAHYNLGGITQLSSVVVGMNGHSNGGGMMMPTIISDESISAPGSPMGSGKIENSSLFTKFYNVSRIYWFKKIILILVFFHFRYERYHQLNFQK